MPRLLGCAVWALCCLAGAAAGRACGPRQPETCAAASADVRGQERLDDEALALLQMGVGRKLAWSVAPPRDSRATLHSLLQEAVVRTRGLSGGAAAWLVPLAIVVAVLMCVVTCAFLRDFSKPMAVPDPQDRRVPAAGGRLGAAPPEAPADPPLEAEGGPAAPALGAAQPPTPAEPPEHAEADAAEAPAPPTPSKSMRDIRLDMDEEEQEQLQQLLDKKTVEVDEENFQIRLSKHVEFEKRHHGVAPTATFADEAAALDVLRDVADVLKLYKTAKLDVEGHSATPDSRLDDWSRTLALSRAEKVRASLESLGVKPERLNAVGKPGRHGTGQSEVVFRITDL